MNEMSKKIREFKEIDEYDEIFMDLRNEIAGYHKGLYKYVYERFLEILLNWGFTDINLVTELIMFDVKRFNIYKRKLNETEIVNHIRYYYKPVLDVWAKYKRVDTPI
jgi:hypothetical protein